MEKTEFVAGLENIIAGESDICFIDGKEGRLVYSGYNVDDLINNNASFEEVVYLLHHAQLPTVEQLGILKQSLFEEYSLPNELIEILKGITKNSSPMVALRSGISLLQSYDLEGEEASFENEQKKALRLVAKVSALVAAIGRIREDQEVLKPKENLSFAANFMYMLQGKEPDKLEERIMNVALILHADHEFNASTFAARVTTATESDIYSAITSAVGTLKGPLHGGANEAVMRLLLEIGDLNEVEKIIQEKLSNKIKISGFGHRVYKTMDPRAVHLKQLSKELGEKYQNSKWYEMTERVEEVVFAAKGLYPNVDLYSASTYFIMGIALDLFTPIFAVSRIAGWTAHVLEQHQDNRIIRPTSIYTGATHCNYEPLERRKSTTV
jgi:citrate synthase